MANGCRCSKQVEKRAAVSTCRPKRVK